MQQSPDLRLVPNRSATSPLPERARDTAGFEFVGGGGQYFRIWIVNLLLSVLTLGIYSAWAKVRRERYFHRATLLAGSSFDYHGNPVAILKGRILAVSILVLVNLLPPAGQVIGMLLLWGALPWLVVRSLRFRAVNTSYCGIRFGFDGSYGGAISAFVLYPLLGVLSLGLLMPFAMQRGQRYIVDHLRYGATRLRMAAEVGRFYKIVAVGLCLALGIAAAFGALSVSLGLWGSLRAGAPHADPALQQAMLGMITLAYLAVFLLVGSYFRVAMNNAVWNDAELGPHRLAARLQVLPFLGITVGNWLGILLTLGLFWPFARVRIARYRAARTDLALSGGLDTFVAGEQQRPGAFGDEMADALDFDIAL